MVNDVKPPSFFEFARFVVSAVKPELERLPQRLEDLGVRVQGLVVHVLVLGHVHVPQGLQYGPRGKCLPRPSSFADRIWEHTTLLMQCTPLEVLHGVKSLIKLF